MPIENRAIVEVQGRIEAIDSQIEFEQERQTSLRSTLNRSVENVRGLEALKADWLPILEHDCGTASR